MQPDCQPLSGTGAAGGTCSGHVLPEKLIGWKTPDEPRLCESLRLESRVVEAGLGPLEIPPT